MGPTRRLPAARAWGLAAALLPACASGFVLPIHQEISEDPLADAGYSAAASEEVVRGNFLTDKDEAEDPRAHFDGEAFAGGSARLQARLLAALEALDACRVRAAREELGRALHPVQDFFSHTNWVENHEDSEPVNLLELKDPEPGVVCDRRSRKGPLTSGYYYKGSDRAAPRGKCLHAALHKDKPGRRFHARARARAEKETRVLLSLVDKMAEARYAPSGTEEVGRRLRQLKGSSGAGEECRPRPLGEAREP